MNIHDVASPDKIEETEILKLIFHRQEISSEKYTPIEVRNGTGYGIMAGRTFNLDDRFSQALIKDFMWRFTEEMMESWEAYVAGDMIHAKEELIDALHFLVELLIIVGEKPIDAMSGLFLMGFITEVHTDSKEVSKEGFYLRPIYSLGMAGNCLKQKPWKSTHVLTDTKRFKQNLWETLFTWAHCAHSLLGMSIEEVHDYYVRKNEVNNFRQRSGY